MISPAVIATAHTEVKCWLLASLLLALRFVGKVTTASEAGWQRPSTVSTGGGEHRMCSHFPTTAKTGGSAAWLLLVGSTGTRRGGWFTGLLEAALLNMLNSPSEESWLLLFSVYPGMIHNGESTGRRAAVQFKLHDRRGMPLLSVPRPRRNWRAAVLLAGGGGHKCPTEFRTVRGQQWLVRSELCMTWQTTGLVFKDLSV
jgi:hypothetical protein